MTSPINYVDPTGHTREDDERYAEEDPTGTTHTRILEFLEEYETEKSQNAYVQSRLIPNVLLEKEWVEKQKQKPGVHAIGLSGRVVAGVAVSFGVYYVEDNNGNSGMLVSLNYGGGLGLGASGGIDMIQGRNLTEISQLKELSTTLGVLFSELIALGYDCIIMKGEEEPLIADSINLGFAAPSPVPVEFHGEIGYSWILFEKNAGKD